MHQTFSVLWVIWLSYNVIYIESRVNSNSKSESHIVLVEENDVRKLLVSASGDGKNSSKTDENQQTTSKKTANSTNDDEERKTLAQQVADGKYGLIQTELFDKPSKRPGIISYDINPEVPKDNINNLGGLQANEIWLAENHLLVLKGGGFSDKDMDNTTWKPIDNYVAPKRQVKIPPKPKVAPPFPVQLKEGGPIEFIQGEKNSFRPFGPPPFLPPDINPNLTSLPPALSYPFPPFGLPPPPSFPFPGNLTDIDEDDPRFYYPPPYDFVYDKANTSHIGVAPGPLVPGIVLPPPVDFFAPLVPKQTGQKTDKRPQTSNKTQKHNQISNSYLPKDNVVIKAKPNTTESPTITSGSKFKDKDAAKTTPDRKEKEGRKPTDNKRPSDNSHSVTRPPEATTKKSRVMAHPPETTTLYYRVISRPPQTTSPPLPKIKSPKLSSGEWVPILGTSICPQGDPRCPTIAPSKHNNKNFKHISLLINSTDKPLVYVTDIPNTNSVTGNNDFYPINGPQINYFTTTASPFYDLKPIIVPTTVTTSAYDAVQPSKYNPEDTVYIYEEPISPGAAKVILRDFDTPEIRNGPTIVYVNHDDRPKYEINTVSPLQVLRDQTVKKPRVKGKTKPSAFEIFEKELSTITNSNTFSITYSVDNREPDVKEISGYSYNVPLDDALSNIITNSHRNNYKNKKGRSKEVKTPVFEYSFSAPGYGQNDSPKISSIIPSTQKPAQDHRQSHYSYFGFDSRPFLPHETYPESNTQSPIEFTSQKSKYRKLILNQLSDYFSATEAPYSQLYTQPEPEYIDDITKNYFNLFGKKIPNDAYTKYITTPLPPVDKDKTPYYDELKSRQRTPKGPKRQNVRFPEETPPPVQNIKDQKDDAYNVQTGDNSGNHRPSGTKLNNYNNRYYNNYRPKYYQRDYSIASDINVNYRKPYPPINPEAEFVDTSYVGDNPPSNSYISYQLPGNGGHFYFLTPQNIHATNYHLASSGVRFPQGYNRLYYKRNAQPLRNRRWVSK